jgi:hypothetical protein
MPSLSSKKRSWWVWWLGGALIALFLVILLDSVISSGGIYRSSAYQGDGRMTDEGIFSTYGRRFTLDLGSVDFTKSSTRSFAMAHLPHVELTVGFDIADYSHTRGTIYETHPIDALVRLTLQNENDQIIFSEEEQLSRWVWSGAMGRDWASFVYRRGNESKDPSQGVQPESFAATRMSGERLGGTYFKPLRDHRYKLLLEILGPASPGTGLSARLVAIGGGIDLP